MLPDPALLLTVTVAALLLAGALAPLEALGWWAGWFGGDGQPADAAALEPADPDDPSTPNAFVVFLTGIHSVSGETFAHREKRLLEELRSALPDVEVLEVFPYSITNRPLTGQRVFAWFWRWALSMKLSKRTLAGIAGLVINLRNGWQMGVSADRRYGPIYNRGSALLIANALREAGYRKGIRVVLIGYSGGGQIALGAAPHVKALTGSPVTVVSLGGVMSSEPAILELERVYDLHGRSDLVWAIGNLFFPGRWGLFPHSSWNQARRQGVVRDVPLGPPDHTGRGGYFDGDSLLPDGRSYFEQSVDVLEAIVRRENPRLRVARPS